MRLPWRQRGDVSCPQCGAAAPGDARWCGTCGAALAPEPDPATDDTDAPGSGAAPAPGRLVAAGVLIVLLGGLLVVQAADEPPVVPAGFMSRGDGARSGVVSHTTVPQPSGVAWRVPVSVPPLLTPGADVLGTTTAADGRELVVVHDPAADGQRVTSHDAATGDVVATTMLPLGSQPHDTSLADGRLAHRDLTTVTLVDLATGQYLWRVEERLRDDTQLTRDGVVGVPAQAEDVAVTLLGVEDGTASWTTSVAESGRVTRVLSLRDTVVVVVDDNDTGLLVGLDPTTGDVVWRLRGGADGLPVRDGRFPEVPIMSDSDHILVVGAGEVALVDGGDGTVHSLVPGPGGGDGPLPSLVASSANVTSIGDGLVVLSDATQRIVGVDVTGDVPVVRWEVPAPGAPVLALAIAGDHVAVRGDSATTLLDAATGNPVATVDPAGGEVRLTMTSDGAVARLTADAALELVGVDGRRWQAPTVAVHLPDLATDTGAVALATPDGVEVFEVADGLRRFAHEAFEPRLVDADSLTPPVLLGGKVSIAPPETQPPDRGGLLSLFADTGIVDWARTVDRVVPRGVVAVDRDLLVVPVGSQLLGFDRATGRRALVVETTIARADVAAAEGWLAAVDAPRDAGDLWVGRRSSRDLVFRAPIRTCAPPVIHEDVVIVVNHLGDIVARELETGEQPWGEKAQGSACRPLSVAEEVVVALVDDRELLAVTLDEGDTAWRVELPAMAAGAPVIAGDQVLVPTLAGEVVAYDVRGTEAPGAPAWSVAVDGTPAGSVAVDGDTILVVTRSGELVALR